MAWAKGFDPLTKFETYIAKMPRAELGGLIKEYIAESNHGGWDGYDRRDLTGIRKFLYDLEAYHYHHDDAKGLATVRDNINQVK